MGHLQSSVLGPQEAVVDINGQLEVLTAADQAVHLKRKKRRWNAELFGNAEKVGEVVSFFHQLSGRRSGAVIFGIFPVFLRRELFTCHLLGIHKDPLHFNGKRLLIFLRKRTAGE